MFRSISDPEARKVAEKALNTLKSACGEVTESFVKETTDIQKMLQEIPEFEAISKTESDNLTLLYSITTNMANKQYFEPEIWTSIYQEYLTESVDKSLKDAISAQILNQIQLSFMIKEEIFEDTEEGENLYQGSFSLAYGALTLLNIVIFI